MMPQSRPAGFMPPTPTNPEYGAFGTYEDYSEQTAGASVLASAVLVTDAEADGEGNLSRNR